MGFFERLREEKRTHEEAEHTAKRQAEEAKQQAEDARLRRENEERLRQAEMQREQLQEKQQFQQAQAYYKQSGCEQYIEAVRGHLVSLGFGDGGWGHSISVAYYRLGASTGQTVNWTRLFTSDEEAKKHGRDRIWQTRINWDVKLFGGKVRRETEGLCYTIRTLMSPDGTLSIGNRQLLLTEWQANPSAIDAAFDLAYQNPTEEVQAVEGEEVDDPRFERQMRDFDLHYHHID